LPVFQIITTATVIELLKVLTETGFYGTNYSEAAERLICQRLQEIFAPDPREVLKAKRKRRPRAKKS
jgi:hypothetical protein